MLTITRRLREENGVSAHVLTLADRLTIGEPSLALREAIREVANHKCKDAILIMSDVPYVDSSGFGELIGAYQTLRNKQGDLKLVALTPKVHDHMLTTKMFSIFDAFDTEDEAFKSLREARLDWGRPAVPPPFHNPG